ncbi:MAG: mitofilin family membrane protein [Halocynthiibacter sp.]
MAQPKKPQSKTTDADNKKPNTAPPAKAAAVRKTPATSKATKPAAKPATAPAKTSAAKPKPKSASAPKMAKTAAADRTSAEIKKPQTASKTPPEKPTPAVETPPKDDRKKSGVFPALLGGAVAVAIGLGVSEYFGPFFGPRTAAPDNAAQTEALSGEIAALNAKIDALTATSTPAPAPTTDFSPVLDKLTSMETSLSDMKARLSKVETGAGSAKPSQAQFAEIEALRAQIDTATKIATTSEMRAAVTEISAALLSGAPYETALTTLGGTAPIGDALAKAAQTGVTPLAHIQKDFATAARAALQIDAKAPEGASTLTKFTSFLKAQTNARSLSPQEGDSTDAILSRADAALKSGDIKLALSEVSALKEAPKSQMSDWVRAAQDRLDVTAEFDALRGQLELN